MNRAASLSQLVGSHVFNDQVMRKRLPRPIYKELCRNIEEGIPLSRETAYVVANAMKEWAVEKGATHFTHWFQPLTEMTAEKHESFISTTATGELNLDLSADMLIQGEPDASSFPSGGLRATFEARGYTVWDCTSPTFLKEDTVGNLTLCIPTAFCSYTGESLDKKTPLLRSMEALSKQAVRLLRALGNQTVRRVISTVGPEQEYFLIDKKHYEARVDLKLCGRTLFGAAAPKGQELEDQYFGSIKDRIAKFMKQLDIELWKMGISAHTKHNEVAPSQYELAVIYNSANIAADHNQLVMESLRKVALHNDMVCLLHEKPFDGINGSGKHNNWSLCTHEGENLLEPGSTPHENLQFLLILAAIIKAIDTHAELLRASIGNAGNDLRLGMHEAPPAIVSIFLGERLTEILLDMAQNKKSVSRINSHLQLGVDTLPQLPRHDTDRNRTSPFAFTGNKFEFRMVASSASIARPNVTLNTITAEAFDEIATRLERVEASEINRECEKIVSEIIQKHQRVIFNGNGYGLQWLEEAKKRELPNITSTVEALEHMVSTKAIALFERYKVMSKNEQRARYETLLENYIKRMAIEAKTAIYMTKSLYCPAILAYMQELANQISAFEKTGIDTEIARLMLNEVHGHFANAHHSLKELEENLKHSSELLNMQEKAKAFRDQVRKAVFTLRRPIDTLESLLPASQWPVPTYNDMLFSL